MRMDYVVGDFMTIDPVVISPSAGIDEAARVLQAFEVSGLPVVDDDGRLLGVISQTDLLQAGDRGTRRLSSASAVPRVADVMSSPPISVTMLTPLTEAARAMRENAVHRVVVVDEAGHAIGVLSSMDFVALYAEG